jgi:ABC-type microcin C transport system duplicated ATPase subunit YejF
VLGPKLLVLDEPTSALDRTTQRAIVKLLRRLQQEHQISYLFISHDLQVVKALCQKVLVITSCQSDGISDHGAIIFKSANRIYPTIDCRKSVCINLLTSHIVRIVIDE